MDVTIREALDTARAFLDARLVGIGKAGGAGVRVLGRGGAPRRMVGRAVTKELHPLFRGHSGG